MKNKLTIATRGSKLALWQAEHIASRLTERYDGLTVELKIIKTSGDKILDVPLAKVGGKGLFVKEIEEALMDGSADLAVHSMKDVPAQLPEGLKLGVMPEREQATDTFLSVDYPTLSDLPTGAVVGTSSLRRQSQVLGLRPDLDVVSLRGNLDTRVRKLKEARFAGIIVATAGLRRLGLCAPHAQVLGPPEFLPAVGQGALGLEYREDDAEIEELLGFMDHFSSRVCVTAERAFLHRLEGGCQVPIAGHATMPSRERVVLEGLVADLEGERVFRDRVEGKAIDARDLGVALAEKVLDAGGRQVLDEIYYQES